MLSDRKITILIHARDIYPDLKRHLIWYIVESWKEMGMNVEVIKGLPSDSFQNDLLLSHIDLTKVPKKYTKYFTRFPFVLNRAMTDISKRRISKNIVSENSAYDGPVIAKTNNNFGGLPESYNSGIYEKFTAFIDRSLWPARIQNMNPVNYEVFDSVHEVPGSIWKNPKMIVERFIPERQGEYYCIRICFFLGNVILNRRVYSKSKVIRGAVVEYSEPEEIPQEIHKIRQDMGLDYGKFDYVVHEGIVHILDVNKTPGIVGDTELNGKVAKILAQGILQYL